MSLSILFALIQVNLRGLAFLVMIDPRITVHAHRRLQVLGLTGLSEIAPDITRLTPSLLLRPTRFLMRRAQFTSFLIGVRAHIATIYALVFTVNNDLIMDIILLRDEVSGSVIIKFSHGKISDKRSLCIDVTVPDHKAQSGAL